MVEASPKISGGSSKFPGGLEVIHGIAQTTFGRVVTPPPPVYQVVQGAIESRCRTQHSGVRRQLESFLLEFLTGALFVKEMFFVHNLCSP